MIGGLVGAHVYKKWVCEASAFGGVRIEVREHLLVVMESHLRTSASPLPHEVFFKESLVPIVLTHCLRLFLLLGLVVIAALLLEPDVCQIATLSCSVLARLPTSFKLNLSVGWETYFCCDCRYAISAFEMLC